MEILSAFWSTFIAHFLTVLYIVDFIIALTIIFLERKNPSATLAWIMVLFLLPVAGIILYLLFSQNIARKKIFRLSRFEEQTIENALKEQIDEIDSGRFVFTNRESRKWRDMIRLNQKYGKAYFTQDNRIKVITDGESMHESLLKDIRNARSTINMMYFIIKNDYVGKEVIRVLTEKAKQGVEVRLLIDAIGGRQILDYVVSDLREAGGQVFFFFPPRIKFMKFVKIRQEMATGVLKALRQVG
jgi:cardiolipin synthase